jgi:hypothetical protein
MEEIFHLQGLFKSAGRKSRGPIGYRAIEVNGGATDFTALARLFW